MVKSWALRCGEPRLRLDRQGGRGLLAVWLHALDGDGPRDRTGVGARGGSGAARAPRLCGGLESSPDGDGSLEQAVRPTMSASVMAPRVLHGSPRQRLSDYPGGVAGRRTVNVVVLSSMLSTRISPPCCSTMSRAPASPTPVPPTELETLLPR